MTRRLVPALLLALASTLACASHDPHLARISELEEENARLERENSSLELRVNGAPRAPAPPIETRCAKNGAGWRITSSGRNELIGNIAGLRRDTRPAPFFSDGKFVGMRLTVMAPGTIGPSCGFEVGDVVRTVNGIEPTVARWTDLEPVLRKTTRIEVDLLRGSDSRTLLIEVSS